MDVDRYLPRGLDCIGMKEGAGCMCYCRCFPDLLHHAGFVIGVHDAHERCTAPNSVMKCIGVHETPGIHPDQRDRETACFEFAGGLENGAVFDRGGDQPPPLMRRQGEIPGERYVVGFGSAPGEVDFIGIGSDALRYLRTTLVEGAFRIPAEGVHARCVPVVVAQIGNHSLDDLGANRCGRVVIEIAPPVHVLPASHKLFNIHPNVYLQYLHPQVHGE